MTPSNAIELIIAKNGLNLQFMKLAREFVKTAMSLLLAILVFNFSICLAEIDAMQRIKPSKQFVEFMITFADMQDAEEDPVPVVEIDLFFDSKAAGPMISPYLKSKKGSSYDQFLLLYHPREIVTPPPEA